MSYLVDNLQRIVGLRGDQADIESLADTATLDELLVAYAEDVDAFGIRVDGTWHWLSAASLAVLDDLTDVVITSPASGDRLRYDGANWVNSALIWKPVMDGLGNVVTDAGTGAAIMTEVSP